MEDLCIPCVARFVTQPTALHWTSTLGLSIWRMRGSRPPSLTIRSLLSAEGIDQGLPSQHRSIASEYALLTARFPRAALAAR